MPAVHILLFSAESVVAGYALRHRAQPYSGQIKNSFCPSFPLPSFQHLKAFFSFPPYRCLSLRFRSVTHRKSHPFPMFLQHIAVIHFTDVAVRFVTAVYTLPSPRTAVWHCPVPVQNHTVVFPIAFPQRVPRNPYLSIKTLLDFESPKIADYENFANFATFTISQDDFPGNI